MACQRMCSVPGIGASAGHGWRSARRRGVIFYMTLVVVMVLMLLAAGLNFYVRSQSAGEAADRQAVQAGEAARAGITLATAMLLDQKYRGMDLGDNPDAFRNVLVSSGPPDWRVSLFRDAVEDDESPAYGLTDEAGKLNLNSITMQQLMALPGMTPDIAAAIIDWRDADDTPQDLGAESEYYQNLANPYRAKNGLFESVDELLLVRGVTESLLYGEDLNRNGLLDDNENDGDRSLPPDNADGKLDRGWYQYLTVYSLSRNRSVDGKDRLNINSGRPDELYSQMVERGFSEPLAEFVRDARAGGVVFRNPADLLGWRGQPGANGGSSGGRRSGRAGGRRQSSGQGREGAGGQSESGGGMQGGGGLSGPGRLGQDGQGGTGVGGPGRFGQDGQGGSVAGGSGRLGQGAGSGLPSFGGGTFRGGGTGTTGSSTGGTPGGARDIRQPGFAGGTGIGGGAGGAGTPGGGASGGGADQGQPGSRRGSSGRGGSGQPGSGTDGQAGGDSGQPGSGRGFGGRGGAGQPGSTADPRSDRGSAGAGGNSGANIGPQPGSGGQSSGAAVGPGQPELVSPLTPEELSKVLDELTTRRQRLSIGLINPAVAAKPVLVAIGFTPAEADAAVSARSNLDPEETLTFAWLIREGVLSVERFKELAPLLTGRGQQFRIDAVGHSGQLGLFRRLEAVIDISSGQPRTMYSRDLTGLGPAYNLAEDESGSMRVKR